MSKRFLYDPEHFWVVIATPSSQDPIIHTFDDYDSAKEYSKEDGWTNRSIAMELFRSPLEQAAILMYAAGQEILANRNEPRKLGVAIDFMQLGLAIAAQDSRLDDIYRDTRKWLLYGPTPQWDESGQITGQLSEHLQTKTNIRPNKELAECPI